MDEFNLQTKYLVVKLEDIKAYMTKKKQKEFWNLFYDMLDEKQECER